MADLKVQGVVEMSTEDAGNQLDRLGNKAGAMAGKMQAGAEKASTAVGKIGDGAQGAADRLTRAESRMADSIKRATTNLQLLGKTASEKIEFQLDEKGLDASKFAPALAQLKAIEAQQLKTGAALAGGSATLDKYGISAKQTANAMRMIPAQMTDIVTQLAGGQNPLQVMLQQGGQLKDVFGGIGPALRGVGSYLAALVNPATVAAAAVAGLAVAYQMGSAEVEKFKQSLTLTGGFADKTAGQLVDMAASISKTAGTTGKAADALNQLVATGKFTGDIMGDIGLAAVAMSEATGKAVGDTIKEFSKFADAPTKTIAGLNEQYHFLTASVYEQVKALEDQGDKQGAANLAERTYADAMRVRAQQIVANVGWMEKAWNGLAGVAKGAWDVMLNVGRGTELEQQLAEVNKLIAHRQSQVDNGFNVAENKNALKQLETQRSFVQVEIENAQTVATALTAAQAVQDRAIKNSETRDAYLKSHRQNTLATALEDENKQFHLAIAGLQENTKEYESVLSVHNAKVAAIEKQFKEKAPSTAGESTIARLRARLVEEQALSLELANQGTHVAKLNEFERQAAAIGEQLKGSLTARARASLETTKALDEQVGALVRNNEAARAFNDAREKGYQAQANTTAKVIEQTQALQDQIDTYGLGKSAVEQMIIARLQEQAAALSLYGDDAKTVVDGIKAEIAARKKLAETMGDKEALDAQKKWADAMDRQNEQIGQSLTDALLRGFESGKDFLENFIDTIKNMFATLVLKPIIQPIVTGIAGAVTGALGFAGPAGAQGSVGTAPSASTASTLMQYGKSAFDFVTGGMNVAKMAGEQAISLGMKFGSEFGIQFGAGLTSTSSMSAAMAAAQAGGTQLAGLIVGSIGNAFAGYALSKLISGGYSIGGNGSSAVDYIAAAASAIPGVGPVAGVIGGLINRAFGKGAKEYGDTSIVGTFGGALGFDGSRQTPWEQAGGWFSSGDSGIHYDPLDTATRQSLGGAFNLIRTGVAALASSVGVSAKSLMSYSEQVKLTLTDDAATNQKLIDDTLSGIGDRMVRTLVPTIGQFAKSGETATQTLQRLGSSLASVNAGLALVRKSLLDISLTGADSASKLADAFGGVDKFSEASQAFYEAAYTDGERAARALQDMQTALQAVGVSMPDTMKQLREMALALDLTTDSGRAAYAALVSLAPTFAQATAALLQQAQQAGTKLSAAFTGTSSSVPALNLAALSDQIITLRANANAATVDFAGLNTALADVDTDTFVAAVTTAFQTLADRVKGVIGDINAERQAVRDAALQIIDPSVMTPDAIARAVGSINTVLPGNGGVVAAGAALNAADALNAQRQQQLQAAAGAYNPALAAFNAASDQVPSLQAQFDNLAGIIAGKEVEIAQPRKYHEGRQYVRDLQATMPALYDQLNQLATALSAAKAASSPDKWTQVLALQSAYDQAVADAADSQAAANAAAVNAKAANTAYADALQAFAIDAGNSVEKLTNLREETVKYYQAQKALADLMTASADGLRKTVSDFRISQLDPERQFTQMRSDFAKNYSLALSTDGETLAGYADKLNSSLNPLLEKAKDAFATDAQYNSFVAQTLARADSIASRLDTLAPSTYEDDSLALLNQIDSTLAALDESSQSASAIITAAINAGRDATVNGLRQVTNALTGQPVAAFATGGDFAGGLRIVGENGPELEATGPSRIFSSVETRNILSGASNDALLAEVRALREEVANLNAAAMATAGNTGKIARQGDRIEIDGLVIRTESDSPILTVAA